MELLAELLALNEDREFEMLLEDLGTLKKLGLGRMVNAFKQSFRFYDDGRRKYSSSGPRASDVGNKIKARETGVGPNSEIIDVKGSIKNWGSIKKAYRDAVAASKDPVAAVIYVENKACALIVGGQEQMTSGKNVFGLAWDFTGLADEDEVSNMISGLNLDNSPKYDDRNHVTDEKRSGKSSERETTFRTYQRGQYVHTAKNFQALGVQHKYIGTFIDALVENFGTKLKVKIITKDQGIAAKASERAANRPIKPSDIKLFKDDIQSRLVKYKLNNAVTVNNVREFIDKVLSGEGKKIKFAGETYEVLPNEDRYSNDSISSMMKGKPISVRYTAAKNPGEYGWDVEDRTVTVTFKLEGMTLKPISVKYREYGEPREDDRRGRPTSDWRVESLV